MVPRKMLFVKAPLNIFSIDAILFYNDDFSFLLLPHDLKPNSFLTEFQRYKQVIILR